MRLSSALAWRCSRSAGGSRESATRASCSSSPRSRRFVSYSCAMSCSVVSGDTFDAVDGRSAAIVESAAVEKVCRKEMMKFKQG